jgi:hypothetical protein
MYERGPDGEREGLGRIGQFWDGMWKGFWVYIYNTWTQLCTIAHKIPFPWMTEERTTTSNKEWAAE